MPQLYEDYLKRMHKSPLLSTSTAMWLVAYIVLIVTPFVFGFYTHNFYTKVSRYFEQPDVQFDKEFAIEVIQYDSEFAS